MGLKQTRKMILESRGMMYAVMFSLVFLALQVLLVGGLYLFHSQGDFYSAFQGGLHNGFYFSAIGALIFTAVLYTPFSYGISNYFILSAQGRSRFSSVFFLFRAPALLLKAIAISILRKLLSYWERLLLLLVAALVEVMLFFGFLLVSGENIFSVKENPFILAAEFMLGEPWLVGISVVLWCGVLFGMFLIWLRNILCKYVMLCYPEVGVLQAIRVGRHSIRGHLLKTLGFYLRYGAQCVITVLTFGLAKAGGEERVTFSVYACDLVEQGWHSYCRQRSRR